MCGEIIDKISLYIDNELSVEEAEELKKHLNECEPCRKEYFEFTDMMNKVKTVTQIELPKDFHTELMKKINDTNISENETNTKSEASGFMKKQKWRKYTTIAASVLTFIVLATVITVAISSMGSKSSKNSSSEYATSTQTTSLGKAFDDSGVTENSIAPELPRSEAFTTVKEDTAELEYQSEEEGSAFGSKESVGINRKIIKYSYLSLETDSFDQSAQTLKTITEQSGGYVESYQSYSNGTYVYNDQTIELKGGSMVLRVPSAKYDSINAIIGTLGKITSQNESSENVTSQYIDTEARLKVKQEEENRLIALIEKANKIEDIITLESRLSEIRSTIESYQSTLKNYDSLVQFSTINININERVPTAVKYEPDESFGVRVQEGFIYSLNSAQAGLENLVVSAVRNMVGLIIFLILLVILLVVAFKKIIPKIRGKL